MGLTIHYRLQAETDAAGARTAVKQLRQRALDLALAEVSELVELRGDACLLENCNQHDPHRWLVAQACAWVEGNQRRYQVPPLHLIAFSTRPGDGSEDANFGLCRYPKSLLVDDPGRPESRKRLRIPGNEWRWSSFCKTQYASDPQLGGTGNFLRCHLSVIALLDQAQALGILGEVTDEGDFWQHRDPRRLAETVGQWNEMIAGFAGRMKDAFGDQIVAAIGQFPNFEHLEARGRRGEA